VTQVRRSSNRHVLLEVMSAIENHLVTAAGNILLPSCPVFQAFCKPWAPQVFGVLLLLRMRLESASCKKTPATGQYPHIKYTRRMPEQLDPKEVCNELEIPDVAPNE